MRLVDLSWSVETDMPVFPGTPAVQCTAIASLAEQGYRETELRLTSHTGTHIDAPAHTEPEGLKLDQMEISWFAGRALVVDCRGCAAHFGLAQLKPLYRWLKQTDFVLFHTGWDRYWNQDRYFQDYPVIETEVLTLLGKAGVRGIGLDTPGLDRVEDLTLPRHHQWLKTDGKPRLIIENLCRLDEIGAIQCGFAAWPLKWKNSDGAPVLAVAWVSE